MAQLASPVPVRYSSRTPAAGLSRAVRATADKLLLLTAVVCALAWVHSHSPGVTSLERPAHTDASRTAPEPDPVQPITLTIVHPVVHRPLR